MYEAIGHLRTRISEPDRRCHFVVTPNVDHTVLLQTHDRLRSAYADADLVLADGLPLVWASRFLRRPLPERVAGSDLVPEFFSTVPAQQPISVFLLGAAPGVANRAAAVIARRWPAVHVVGTYSPPLGFERNEAENCKIIQLIAESRPDVLIVGLGAPKQECWVHQHRASIHAKVALCVGATIDFLAGERKRAPRWMQRVGLEWFYRMSGEPKRLVRRYALDAWHFPQIVWRQWRAQRSKSHVSLP
jgi:N-acetylglucosaminyldiphosphoundecaprenol N-acetyl-beta-D-mannosaminyltransferase